MEFTSCSTQETFELGQKIGNYLKTSSSKERGEGILCLYGPLGSGKTVFSQGVAKGLGINSVVSSPTFIIVRRYDLLTKNYSWFYHVDLYRVDKKQEILGLGLTDFFSGFNCLFCIEWAEKLKDLVPSSRINVHFDIIDETMRGIIIKLINIKDKKRLISAI